ncbi:MAG TPA: lamin tail domain-containing protein [Kribbella sp.]
MFVRRFSLPVIASIATATAAATAVVGLAVPLPAMAVSSVLLTGIQYDPPGKDTRTNAHLNQEYVTVRNSSTKAISLAGWRIRDAQNHTFVFPRGYVLKARTTATIRTGKGKNTATTLYWNQGNYIWNNTGDTARFQNPANRVIDTCSYKAVKNRARVAC